MIKECQVISRTPCKIVVLYGETQVELFAPENVGKTVFVECRENGSYAITSEPKRRKPTAKNSKRKATNEE